MDKTRTILIAEDDGDDAFIFRNACTLAALDHQLRFVRDGQEAINYLQGKPPFGDREKSPEPHPLVADLKMPGVDGFDLLRWVRSTPKWKELPVVVLSGSDYAGDKHRATQLGASDYLVKPGWGDQMLELVRQLSTKYLRDLK